MVGQGGQSAVLVSHTADNISLGAAPAAAVAPDP